MNRKKIPKSVQQVVTRTIQGETIQRDITDEEYAYVMGYALTQVFVLPDIINKGVNKKSF